MDKKLPDNFDYLFWLLRIIFDVIFISLLKTIFKKSMEKDHKTRRATLIVTAIMVTLNFIGIYRNSFTLWNNQGLISYFFLGIDIVQIMYCMLIWCISYFKNELEEKDKKIIVYFSVLFILVNIYNFLINFYYLKYEGLKIFLFWFVNNLGMIAFCASIAYMVYFIMKIDIQEAD